MVTEFSAPNDEVDAELKPIFSRGSSTIYRLEHERPPSCPCEVLGEYGCPVDRYMANNGRLTLVFHAADYEELRAIIHRLQDRFPKLSVNRFIRAPAESDVQDTIYVDRSRLTERQLEVLTTAYEMGYFERPRRANASEIATELGIDPSTFSQHLSIAERKLFEDVLEGI